MCVSIVFFHTGQCPFKGMIYFDASKGACAPCVSFCNDPFPALCNNCLSGCSCPFGKVVDLRLGACVKPDRCPKAKEQGMCKPMCTCIHVPLRAQLYRRNIHVPCTDTHTHTTFFILFMQTASYPVARKSRMVQRSSLTSMALAAHGM